MPLALTRVMHSSADKHVDGCYKQTAAIRAPCCAIQEHVHRAHKWSRLRAIVARTAPPCMSLLNHRSRTGSHNDWHDPMLVTHSLGDVPIDSIRVARCVTSSWHADISASNNVMVRWHGLVCRRASIRHPK